MSSDSLEKEFLRLENIVIGAFHEGKSHAGKNLPENESVWENSQAKAMIKLWWTKRFSGVANTCQN